MPFPWIISASRGWAEDNTKALSANTWRHVAFIEQAGQDGNVRADILKPFQSDWLMMSDLCKHCTRAGCLEACPTGALFRTEFGTVVVQQDICNGCAYCVPSCPFGVIELNERDGKAHKCTLCYDRLKGGLEPACAKSCPTNSILPSSVRLRSCTKGRPGDSRICPPPGAGEAYLYGAPGGPGATGGIDSLHAFFLLLAPPEVYNLPEAPSLPLTRAGRSLATGMAAIALLGLASAGTHPIPPRKARTGGDVT